VRAPDLPKNLEDLHSHIASQAEGVELIFACRRIDEARHLTKTLARTGLTTAKEPYMRAFALGTVDGDGHVPVTDAGTYIDRYGADTVRCFMIFMGPHDHDLHFSDGQIGGVHRFLSRLWRLAHDLAPQTVPQPSSPMGADLELLRRAHQTMDHVTEAMEGELRLHMVIAAIMGLVRESIRVRDRVHGATIRFAIQTAARLLFPFAPYCAADVYHQLTSERVWEDPWPVADPILMGGRGAR
jgi:leucyl-tRNA synthetase